MQGAYCCRVVLSVHLFVCPLVTLFDVASCHLLVKECALSTGKLPKRLAQE